MRVSTLASVFDSKFGIVWSRATFGVDGASTRVYGTVAQLEVLLSSASQRLQPFALASFCPYFGSPEVSVA